MKRLKPTYNELAEEINAFLRKNNVKMVKKSDLSAKFDIIHDDRTAIYSALEKLGWRINWTTLEAT